MQKTLLAGLVALCSGYALADEAALQGRIEALEKEVQALKAAPKITKVDGGFRAATADNVYQFRVIGSMFADTAFYDKDKAELGSGSLFRRARLGIRGAAAKNWDYKFEIEFAGGSPRATDYYIAYKGLPDSMVYIGNALEFFSFEEITSSTQTMFMERSYGVDAFAEDYNMGLAYLYWQPGWSVGVGVHGDNATTTQTDGTGAAGRDEGLGSSARLTFAPKHEAGDILHLGVSAAWRNPAADTLRIRTRADTRVTDVRLVDTGSMANVDNYTTLGLEAAAVMGPFTVQGEYARRDVMRSTGGDLSFDGYYVQAAYMLTGEKRAYYSQFGVFDGIKPAAANRGAWELAARYDTIDLDDGTVKGGEQKALTLGLNYYVNYNLRFMLNAIQVKSEKAGVDDDPRILQARAALYF